MPSPFFYSGRIENSSDFIGRNAELRAIFSALEHFSSGQAQHISIVGERRIGKSSLLYHITQVYKQHLSQPEHYNFVFIDLDNTHNHTLHGLLHFILKQLGQSTTNSLTLTNFDEALEKLHNKNKVRPVLCLDEFEHLASRKDEFPNDVYEAFRSLGSNNIVAFLTASKTPLFNLINQSNMTSTFPNIFMQLPLGELTESEANQLTQRGQISDRPFNDEDVKHMRMYGGKHPYKLQIAGEKIYLAKAEANIDWKKIQLSIENQIKHAGLEKKSKWHKILWLALLSFLRSLGRAVLEVRKSKDEISDSTTLWWGIIVILAVALILLGLPLGWLFKFGSHWLGK